MKKIISGILIASSFFISGIAIASGFGSPAPYSTGIQVNNSSGTTYSQFDLADPQSDRIYGWDSNNHIPMFYQADQGLAIVGGHIFINNLDQSEVVGLTDRFTALENGKVATTTYSSDFLTISSEIGMLSTEYASIVSASSTQADWSQASSTIPSFIKNKPSIPSAQIPSDWNQTSTTSPDYLKNKPILGVSYEGTTQRVNSFPIFKSATVSSGVAVVNLTSDGTSGGMALCANGVIADSVSPTVSDATASYQMSWAFTNSNKTLTVTTNKLTTANILTGILGQSAANASVVKISVWCY